MNQKHAPILDALAGAERRAPVSFAAPGHHQGAAMPSGMRRLLGKRVFEADVMTPKGLDDRTESLHAIQRAHEIAAEAWRADLCRFVTGGSTQSLQIVMATVVSAGDTLLIAGNAHKAERSYALAAGIKAVVVPVTVDADLDIEHGVSAESLASALEAHPDAKAFMLVSPTYFGVTSDVATLADLCHRRGIPLLVDAAWGGAFAFSERLPDDPLAKGADACVYSAHKTMGALAQGSVIVARGGHLDLQRLAMTFELFGTTSLSVPILASIDATRRDHALNGEHLWRNVLDLAGRLRRGLAAISGLRLFGRDDLPPGCDIDESKVLVDISALGVSGYAIDDWLFANHGIHVGLADMRHLLLVVSLGTRRSDIRALLRGLSDLVARLAANPGLLPPAPVSPPIGDLSVEMARGGGAALFGKAEMVRYEDAANRIAAETIAPAPPGIPRLVPGQRISATHVAWLVANRDAGAFVLDPVDPSERMLRVTRDSEACHSAD